MVFIPTVQCPFPDVATGIKQSKRVGLIRPNWKGFVRDASGEAMAAIGIVFAHLISPPIFSGRASVGHIFPFRF